MRYLSTLLLAGALLEPAGLIRADDEHHEKVRRYYDRERHDYHEWNEQEEHAYKRYIEEQKRENRAWNKAGRREQAEYWKWRHDHPDVR